MKMVPGKMTQIAVIAALLVTALISPAFVAQARAETEVENETETETTNTRTPSIAEGTEAARERPKTGLKLEQKKLEVCQKHENTITERFKKMSSSGEKQLAVFDKIFERVKAFKTEKNLTVSNYDQLVQVVSDKQKLATAYMHELSTTTSSFGCSKDDPKGVSGQFKDKLKAQIQALKDYKTALKNLIVAVKSSQSKSNEESN